MDPFTLVFWNKIYDFQQFIKNGFLNKENFSTIVNDKKETLLHYAAQRGCFDICKLIIDLGIDVNIREPERLQTPLHRAAFYEQKDVCKLLLDYGSTVDPLDIYNLTPLEWSSCFNDGDETSDLLLMFGAKVTKTVFKNSKLKKNDKNRYLFNNYAVFQRRRELVFLWMFIEHY